MNLVNNSFLIKGQRKILDMFIAGSSVDSILDSIISIVEEMKSNIPEQEYQIRESFKILMKIVIEHYQKEGKLKENDQYHDILHFMAYHDPLTNLPNRRFIENLIDKEIEFANQFNHQFSILNIDLDQFKPINDFYGRKVGDIVLLEIASRISQVITDLGVAGHIGGDEFLILLPQISVEQSILISKILLSEIEKPIVFEQYELYITASIGISMYPTHGLDALSLQKNADSAMNRIKNKGGNDLHIFDPALEEKTYVWLTLYNDLHKALVEEEFCLYYQPKIDIQSNKIVGVEALIRWQHPLGGMIPPANFIPLAEKSRFIHDLGKWVLLTACRQAKAWQDQGYPKMMMSVNISARQLESPNFVEVVKEVLEETKLEGKWLELEITESMLVGNKDSTTQTLNSLKKLGIKISIDDFGTGYSSLNYIQKFPIDYLKIDQTFVNEIKGNSDSSLVSAIIELGHSLQLRVIAEGVENEEQLNYLRKHGCDEWQGYLYSPPVPHTTFEHLLQTYFHTTH